MSILYDMDACGCEQVHVIMSSNKIKLSNNRIEKYLDTLLF